MASSMGGASNYMGGRDRNYGDKHERSISVNQGGQATMPQSRRNCCPSRAGQRPSHVGSTGLFEEDIALSSRVLRVTAPKREH